MQLMHAPSLSCSQQCEACGGHRPGTQHESERRWHWPHLGAGCGSGCQAPTLTVAPLHSWAVTEMGRRELWGRELD